MTVTYPLLPLRDIVVFPGMVAPLFVGRAPSVAALELAMAGSKELAVFTQVEPETADPGQGDLHEVGVIGSMLQMLKLPDGTVRVLVEGQRRVSLVALHERAEAVIAEVSPVDEKAADDAQAKAMIRQVVERFGDYAKMNKKLDDDAGEEVAQIEDAGELADTLAAAIDVKVSAKQSVLNEPDPAKRLEMLLGMMDEELSVLQVERKIRGRVKRQMEKSQREYYLNEQMKAIQNELGGAAEEGEGGELGELEQRIRDTRLSKEAREKAEAELKKLRAMQPMSAEATVIRTYLDVLLGLPWGKKSRLKKDLGKAQAVLDADHHGLEKVKERIVEYLAVQARTNKLKGPILCLVGPPGVGKTSLGKSIARATGRKFVRQSLGGVRDEAEIRGHRRTYIGSLPGKIVTNLKKAGASNPLILLDEIDKLGADFRGDPASAPARSARPRAERGVPGPLPRARHRSVGRNVRYHGEQPEPAAAAARPDGNHSAWRAIRRMKRWKLPSEHLLPKQIEAARSKAKASSRWRRPALRDLIRFYTREAGVRTLEREIARLARKALAPYPRGRKPSAVTITPDNLGELRRRAEVQTRFKSEEEAQIGAVTGLAWTEVGRRSPHHRIGVDADGLGRQGRDQNHWQAGRGDDREHSRPPSVS